MRALAEVTVSSPSRSDGLSKIRLPPRCRLGALSQRRYLGCLRKRVLPSLEPRTRADPAERARGLELRP